MYRAIVLTVSDRSFRGEREDRAGPLAKTLLSEAGYRVVRAGLVPDEQGEIEDFLRQAADSGEAELIVTTGGTGFAPRDVTPEATCAVCDRMAPGLGEAMRSASLRITPHAMLSRAQAGMRKNVLILNLPGSPKAVAENLAAVFPALGHALALLNGETPDQ